jgi:hypothetical protein
VSRKRATWSTRKHTLQRDPFAISAAHSEALAPGMRPGRGRICITGKLALTIPHTGTESNNALFIGCSFCAFVIVDQLMPLISHSKQLTLGKQPIFEVPAQWFPAQVPSSSKYGIPLRRCVFRQPFRQGCIDRIGNRIMHPDRLLTSHDAL